ncbi:MAG TPA: thiamine pyrophosphate-binding protein [Candidatus Dormibacteraeota bacterium]|nr:thiamine pyrophosphate-binding protein [Candidatus Dormibacteraeota bacterium]
MRSAAAELLSILHDEGVSHVFVDPDMHTAPLRAALSAARDEGAQHPQLVLCVDERVAVAAAHGHHLAGGRPQAVMVEVEAAQRDLGGALESAQRDRVPATVFWGVRARTAPAEDAAAPDWPVLSGARPPAGKWTADLTRGDWSALVRRAFQLAQTEPPGLTHAIMTRDLLGQPGAGNGSRRLTLPRPAIPDPAALEEIADLLATAESPLIVAGRVGRTEESVTALASLAETLAAPVIDVRNYVNLPPRHALNAAMESRQLLSGADAVLLLDVDAPCVRLLGPVPQRAWLLQIDRDCTQADVPGRPCPVEVAVTGDTARALGPLQTMLADRLAGRRRQVQERRARAEAAVHSAHEEWRARAGSGRAEDASDAVLAEVDRSLPDDAVVLLEADAQAGAALRQLERPVGHLFHTSAGAPGWTLGAGLGASLARPGQPIVAVCDEAAFVAGLPAAVFWCARRAAAPFLTVVLDRQRRPPGRRSGTRRTEVAPVPADAGVAVREAESDVVALARAAGAEADVVDEPASVGAVLERLLATTRDGMCAVLDARLRRT